MAGEEAGGGILEVGCFSGSEFTARLAEASGHYVGVELSPKAAEALRGKFQRLGLAEKCQVVTGDILTFDPPTRFDLIYCHAVLHHFENPRPAFAKLASLLKPDGLLLFTEPSAVNPLYHAMRLLYRPFQSDRAWEWPFTQATVLGFREYFEVLEGFGWGRHSLPLSVLTMMPLLGSMFANRYASMVRDEASEGWGPEVWKNSYVTGIARLRNPLRQGTE